MIIFYEVTWQPESFEKELSKTFTSETLANEFAGELRREAAAEGVEWKKTPCVLTHREVKNERNPSSNY